MSFHIALCWASCRDFSHWHLCILVSYRIVRDFYWNYSPSLLPYICKSVGTTVRNKISFFWGICSHLHLFIHLYIVTIVVIVHFTVDSILLDESKIGDTTFTYLDDSVYFSNLMRFWFLQDDSAYSLQFYSCYYYIIIFFLEWQPRYVGSHFYM